jgi:hypothetical protein
VGDGAVELAMKEGEWGIGNGEWRFVDDMFWYYRDISMRYE